MIEEFILELLLLLLMLVDVLAAVALPNKFLLFGETPLLVLLILLLLFNLLNPDIDAKWYCIRIYS